MPPRIAEIAFEIAIESHLVANGYTRISEKGFDRALAIFPETILDFIRKTQPKEWAKLEALHGAHTDEQIITDLCKWMDAHGSLATFRHGFKCYGLTLRPAFFKAAHGLNPELEARYAKNCLGLTRQLHFSERDRKSLDVTISLNGIPIFTVELKNPLTNQTVDDAINQYKATRDAREPLFEFKRRTLVHFAVDTEVVFMTTRLAGTATHFLPFNKGQDGGAGNPPDPQGFVPDDLISELDPSLKHAWQTVNAFYSSPIPVTERFYEPVAPTPANFQLQFFGGYSPTANLNNYSVVTVLNYFGLKFLFPGDLEEIGRAHV